MYGGSATTNAASSVHGLNGMGGTANGESDNDNHPASGTNNNNNGTILDQFYETVDAPCRVACQGSIEHQLDLLTHCRQPMAFLSFFQEHATHDSVGVEVLPAGAYVLPTFCEYCGAERLDQCVPGQCQRPALYFQKKRPPFAKADEDLWDPATDHFKKPVVVEEPEPQPQTSWLSMFSSASDGG